MSALLLCCEGFDFSQHLRGFCKERKLCAYSEGGSYGLTFGKGTKLMITPSKFSSFGLIILPKKPVLHHTEAVKTQVVFSLLGLCWVIPVGKQGYECMDSLGHCAWLLLSKESLPEKMCEPPRGGRSRESKEKKGRNRMKIDKRPAGITNKMGSQESSSSRVE